MFYKYYLYVGILIGLMTSFYSTQSIDEDFCQSSKPCGSNNCSSFIINDNIHFLCDCINYVSYNESCDTVEPLCEQNCTNNGTCTFYKGKPRCSCPSEYRGPSCEYLVLQSEPCEDVNQCLNGGECIKSNNSVGFECNCPFTHSGAICENYLGNTCVGENPCGEYDCAYFEPGGIPLYLCNCTDYVAYNQSCDSMTSDCPLSCMNGGVCTYSKGKAVCSCPKLYRGSVCEYYVIERDPCNISNKPCLNGGICRTGNSSYDFVCDCPNGTKGEQCETILNYCELNQPCYPDICLWDDKTSTFYCKCGNKIFGANQTCKATVTPQSLKSASYVLKFEYAKIFFLFYLFILKLK